MGEAVFTPCCLTWDQTKVEAMKIMGTAFKRSHDALLHSVPLTLQQATTDPVFCQRLLNTHRQVWASLLWGHCSFLLGPGAQKVLFVPSKSLFPQVYVSPGGSMVGLMVTFSKRAMPYLGMLHPEPLPLWQATADLYLCRRHSNTVLSQSQWDLWVLVCTRFFWALQASLAGMGFDSKCDFAPPTILLGLLLCPWMWGISFWWDPTFSCWRLFSNEL